MSDRITILNGQSFLLTSDTYCCVSFDYQLNDYPSQLDLCVDSFFIMKNKQKGEANDDDCVYYNNQSSRCNAVQHIDACSTGIEFSNLPKDIDIIDIYLFIQNTISISFDDPIGTFNSISLEIECNNGQTILFEYPRNLSGLAFHVASIERTSSGWLISNRLTCYSKLFHHIFEKMKEVHNEYGKKFSSCEIVYDVSNKPIFIDQILDHFHYADIYSVSYNGERKRLIWFFHLESKEKSRLLYEEVKRHITMGAPDDAFIWPQAITQFYGLKFGYIVPQISAEYVSTESLLLGKIEMSDLQKYRVCKRIAESVNALHTEGLCFKELDILDFLVNIQSSKILYQKYDYITPQFSYADIGYRFGVTAPEIIKGNKQVNKFTDAYALSTIMYKLLVDGSDPFVGKKYQYLAPCMTEKIGEKIYIDNPLFVFNQDDKSNYPDQSISMGKITAQRWKRLPNSIQQLFFRAFSKKAVDDQTLRVSDAEWISVLNQEIESIIRNGTKDSIFNCYLKQGFQDISLVLGMDGRGEPYFVDINKMESCLIAGIVGSGKTSYIISIIKTLQQIYSPLDYRLAVICKDKSEYSFLEFSCFNFFTKVYDYTHSDNQSHDQVFQMLIKEIRHREILLSSNNVCNISQYNTSHSDAKIPHLIFIIDDVQQVIEFVNDLFSRPGNRSYYYSVLGIHFIISASQNIVEHNHNVENLIHKIPSRVILRLSSAEVSNELLGDKTTVPIEYNKPYFYFTSVTLEKINVKMKRYHLKQLLNQELLSKNRKKTVSLSDFQHIWIVYDNNEEKDHSNAPSGIACAEYDLFSLLINERGNLLSESDCVFYNNLRNNSHSIIARGDGISINGLDAVYVDFSKIPQDAEQIMIFAKRHIYDDVKESYKVLSRSLEKIYINEAIYDDPIPENSPNPIEFERDDYETDITHVCSIVRQQGIWFLTIVSEGIRSSLEDLLRSFGMAVD